MKKEQKNYHFLTLFNHLDNAIEAVHNISLFGMVNLLSGSYDDNLKMLSFTEETKKDRSNGNNMNIFKYMYIYI
uniref:Uncharacterized protein n=1 Tax=Onchocerca volvulus TaxID=6282 RepID=A0A8R1Y0U1_ONCVO